MINVYNHTSPGSYITGFNNVVLDPKILIVVNNVAATCYLRYYTMKNSTKNVRMFLNRIS